MRHRAEFLGRSAGIAALACCAATWGGAASAQSVAATPRRAGSNAATAVQAPLTPGDTTRLETVVVTAQRRSQSLQKTALTIEVIGRKSLAAGGVTVPSQLTTVLPTVQVATSGPATAVYVRGVGGFASTAATSPAVPYYIDGVYAARTQSVASEFYDVDRLELVKGPQGTLYGRNASGGAINILTRRPDTDSVSGHVDFELGDYGDKTAEFAVNVPVSPTFAIRASGTVVDKDGYTSTGLGDDKHESGRLKALWKPNNDVTFLFNGSYGHIGGLGPGIVALNQTIPGWYPWLGISDPKVAGFVAQNAVVPVPGFVRNTVTSDARQDLSFYNLSGQLDWNLGPAVLTVLPAFRRSDMQYAGLFGFLLDDGYGIGTQPARPQTSSATSLEVRLSGNSDALKWVGGFYFANEDQFEQYTINGGFLQSVGINQTLGTRSYAGFGQATYSVTPHFRIIGGARYTTDERSLSDGSSYIVTPAAFLGPPPPQAAPCALGVATQPQCLVDSYAGQKTFNNVSWKGGFEADVLQDSLLYATASRGFKAGGLNSQSAAGTPGQALTYSPETLTSYDVGLKSRFLDNRLQVNVSGFYWDYRNHQEPVLTYTNVPGVTNLVYLNAGSSEIYGGDLDIVARPWSGATINSGVEFAHSLYNSFAVSIPTFSYSPAAKGCPVTSQDPVTTTLSCAGYETSRTPVWSGNLGLTQQFDVSYGKFIASGNLTFASGRWIGTDFIAQERVKAYSKLDALLTYVTPSGRWSVTAFVRNITDARIYTDGARDPFSPLIYADIQPPRTYGGRLSFEF